MSDSSHYSNDTKWPLILRASFSDRDWIERAACKNSKVNFFPVFYSKLDAHNRQRAIEIQRNQVVEALEICATCPVIEQCKKDHLHEREGVFYGTVPAERDLLRNRSKTCDCLWCKDFRRKVK